MATKTSNFVSLRVSLFILLLFISSQVAIADAKHLQHSTTIKKSKRSSIQSTDAACAAATTTAPAPDAECSHTSPNAAVVTTAAENACIITAATNALSTSFVAVCFIADVYITKEKDDAGGSRITKKEADASMR
ncbi:unnamed protein product [Arabidopsis thaliana]|uniref:uncharacterized protein n=1 Tax=Arabidopsis thaliana TaxID=3702 RepID=UPI00000A4112|nr:uncharacterized protein AT5G44570 [Arabidopsis thaliana]AED95127.1 transmembrane protein [Arabidopsis thaliana]BAA98110.1 unnamed protein product [Arabidopsis thaliana]|eukprot:NP_199270.1 transmembrane protein [Arabidopsis thaliana]